MGYICLPRQSTAEYLTAVTDPNGRFSREGMEDRVPIEYQELLMILLLTG